jgi:phosphoglycerol transferase MdoB-like AlkP superfamily enzyme
MASRVYQRMYHCAVTYIRRYGFAWLWSAVLCVWMEALSRNSLMDGLWWSVRQAPLWLWNSLLLTGLVLLVTSLSNRPRAAFWLVAAPGLLLALGSGVKLRMLGLPLLPWDFKTADDAGSVLNWSDVLTLHTVGYILSFVAIAFGLVHRFKFAPAALDRRERAALGAASLVLVLALVLTGARYPGETSRWDPAADVRTQGLALSFLRNTGAYLTGSLSGQGIPNREALARVLAATAQAQESLTGPDVPRAKEPVRPNIILVLSESFWDPTKLPNVRFSRDPVPFFHDLQQRYTSGWLLSPRFGGMTANVEFEVLTGLSMQFLPPGVLVYNGYVEKPVDSLAAILRRQGYEATAISPWAYNFFNSEKVYRLMGFSRFISLEFLKPDYNGYYLRDSEVARAIIQESQRTPGPDFIFANTAENHYDYNPGKFPGGNTIRVEGLPDQPRGLLETYAQGCAYADQMLRTLVEHYQASGEPTMIIFFGDHLPFLGEEYLVYRAAGYITGETDPDFLEKIYRVPVVIWQNFRTEQREELRFGTNQLGPYILEQAGFTGTPVTAFLRDLGKRVPAIPPRQYWDAWGIRPEALQEYQALQYDILHGEQLVYRDIRDRIVDPNYVLGYGPLQITAATVAGDGSTLTVQGQHLPPRSVVYLNGQPLQTQWLDLTTVRATVPADHRPSGTWQVQVRVLDQKGEKVIAASNPLSLN